MPVAVVFLLALVEILFALWTESTTIAVAVAAQLIWLMTFRHWRLYAILAACLLPLSSAASITVSGAFVPLSDLLALTAIASYLMLASNHGPGGTPLRDVLAAVRVPALFAAPYLAWGAWGFGAHHPGLSEALTLMQRAEIIVVWTALGAVLWRARFLWPVLAGYVITCVILSLAWLSSPGAAGVLGVQKNPSGGFIAAAILVTLLSKHRYRLPAVVILALGLVATGSRGSMLLLQWRRAGEWVGVGWGNYEQQLRSLRGVDTPDPHNVYVLALVEGGYIGLATFVFMVAGVALWLFRHSAHRVVALALLVHVSLFAHAYVDVYWVRGTPAPAWLLVGSAGAAIAAARSRAGAGKGGRCRTAAVPAPTPRLARASLR